MNKFMKKFMKKDGFTLVELIVVIAILAILAGVAVPAYSGYIGKANEAADTTQLSAVKTAAQAACATIGEVKSLLVEIDSTNGNSVNIVAGSSSYELVYKNSKWTATASDATSNEDDVASDFNAYMSGANITLKSDKFKTTAEWSGNEWGAHAHSYDVSTSTHKCTCGDSHASVDTDTNAKCDTCGLAHTASTPAT